MVMNRIEDFIKIYNDVFTSDYCEELIDYIEQGDPKFIDHQKKPRFHELVLEPDMVKRCVDTLNPFLDRYVESVGCDLWLPPTYTYEYARVKKYRKETEDQFGPHVDVADHKSSRRFLAFLVYLNDVPQGGETSFLGIDKYIRPKRGRMIVFPPLWMVPHQGHPAISNDKYILSTYLHYL
jgi:hypothetical protein